jgi:hypothetical protein
VALINACFVKVNHQTFITALRMTSKDMRLAVWNAEHMHCGCIKNDSVLVNIASETPLPVAGNAPDHVQDTQRAGP